MVRNTDAVAMSQARIAGLTVLAMMAFAGNSILCRLALRHTAIDPASFTAIRIFAGALMLWLMGMARRGAGRLAGNWGSALALFTYAAGFSFAYVSLPVAAGALLLFGAVQATMIGFGLWRGERLGAVQMGGLALACCGLVYLLLPGLAAPPLAGSALMLAAGAAWGVYSLRGKGSGNATATTSGNFVRAAAFAAALSAAMMPWASLDRAGVVYAVASGAITSGVGYAIWYTALPRLKVTSAATVQLSVPVITALGGVLFLSEPITQRLAIASAAILSGVVLVIVSKGGVSSQAVGQSLTEVQ